MTYRPLSMSTQLSALCLSSRSPMYTTKTNSIGSLHLLQCIQLKVAVESRNRPIILDQALIYESYCNTLWNYVTITGSCSITQLQNSLKSRPQYFKSRVMDSQSLSTVAIFGSDIHCFWSIKRLS